MEEVDQNAVVILVDWEQSFEVHGMRRLKVPNEGAEKSDFITWRWAGEGKDGDFFILFPDASPFSKREFASQHGVVSQQVVYDPSTGGARKFKYIIAGCDGKVMHILDPEIIVPKPGRAG